MRRAHHLSAALRPGMAVLLALGSAAAGVGAASLPPPHFYDIRIDERRPAEAEVRLTLASAPARLSPARDGDGSGIADPRCEDGRPLVRAGNAWTVPAGCTRMGWRIALRGIDAEGLDASLPGAAYSLRHAYWLLPERGGLLRASGDGGTATISLRLGDGRTIRRDYAFPSNDQPPFYAVAGAPPAHEYGRDGFTLRVFGAPPDFPWMEAIHGYILSAWAAWRRDLVAGAAPDRIDWAWVQAPRGMEPGYNASAGAEAIVSQIKLRDGDPDAEAKARVIVAVGAAHEGFHSLTGGAGQAWPAWVNESLASHFAIAAASRFLAAEDRRWLDHYYIAPDLRSPLLDAQARYEAGDGEQAQLFYIHGARFWREIEQVLTNPPNPSGRLAALILQTNNFAGTDLENAGALAALLDRHSDGRAGPIVRRFLER